MAQQLDGDTTAGGGPTAGTSGQDGNASALSAVGSAGLTSKNMPVVLMYHSVTPYDDDPYLVTVTPGRFERQLDWLRSKKMRGVSVADLIAARRAGEGRDLVGLTFDDGYADFVSYAMPLLARRGFGATLFPIAGRLGGQNDWDAKGPRKPLMTADQVRQAADAGIEIGSHGMQHVSLPGTTDPELADEAGQSRAILQQAADQPVAGFCYPYGHIDDRVVAAVQGAGYAYGCAIWRSGATGPHAIPRVYVGDGDSSLRLWAKGVRHWLTWDYNGPGANRLADRIASGAPDALNRSGPSQVQHFA
jgi:peptidoglycan/xylan/chitin deacetylase (PgdA/CDA1 family)